MGRTVRIRAVESRGKKRSRRDAAVPAVLVMAATALAPALAPAWAQDAGEPQGGATLSLPAVSVTASGGNLALAADRKAVEDAMTRTGVADFAGRPVDALSGGERQRVWLAMMVAQRPAPCCWTSRPRPSTSRIGWRCCP